MSEPVVTTLTGAGQELVMIRVFDAPRELVFKMWTDPEHVARWWGPKGFTNPVCEVDARPGGRIEIHMQGPDGQIHPMAGTFDEVVAPERIVLTSGAIEDEQGEPQLLVHTTVTFEDVEGGTRLTMHAVILRATGEAAGAVAGMEQGWTETLDRLAEHLAKS